MPAGGPDPAPMSSLGEVAGALGSRSSRWQCTLPTSQALQALGSRAARAAQGISRTNPSHVGVEGPLRSQSMLSRVHLKKNQHMCQAQYSSETAKYWFSLDLNFSRVGQGVRMSCIRRGWGTGCMSAWARFGG